MLEALISGGLFAFFLVFARLGSAMMLLPGVGEAFVPPTVRLALAVLVSLLVLPAVWQSLPPQPASPSALVLLLLGEVVIGLFLGTLARLLMSSLSVAGMVIAQTGALANAMVNDPISAQQGAIPGNFLTVTAVVVLLLLDLHHLLLRALVDSYGLFLPGDALPVGDFAEVVTRTVAEAFVLAVRMAAPFIVVGTIFFLGLGLLARLMPQVQIFFIAMPLQIALALLVLALSLPLVLRVYLEGFEQTFLPYLAP